MSHQPMVPPDALRQWNDLVQAAAQEFNLNPYVISAQVWKESEADLDNPRLTRVENGWRYFWDPVQHGSLFERGLKIPGNRQKAMRILDEAEFWFQSTSHGLMQPMGAVCREQGYDGDFEGVYDPATNLHYGCKYHAVCLRRARGDQEGALTLYNGNPAYAVEVLRRATILEAA